MGLATPEYIEQNRQMHATRPDYGSYGSQWTHIIATLASRHGLKTILDYGAGKRGLETELAKCPGVDVTSYDPAVAEIAEHPTGKFDLVVCTDVLEHIEPDCLDDVLRDIAELTGRMAFLEIALFEAKKILPDGRNAHLIVEDGPWWLARLRGVFTVDRVSLVDRRLLVYVSAKAPV